MNLKIKRIRLIKLKMNKLNCVFGSFMITTQIINTLLLYEFKEDKKKFVKIIDLKNV